MAARRSAGSIIDVRASGAASTELFLAEWLVYPTAFNRLDKGALFT